MFFIDNNRFDIHTWQPILLETAKEIYDFFEYNKLFNKTIDHISTIGMAHDFTEQYLKEDILDSLKDFGLPNKKYPFSHKNDFDTVKIPQKVTLSEPVVIAFEDSTRLEILPCFEKGLFLSLNQTKNNITDGLNKSNIDSTVFFKDIKGAKIFDIKITEENITYIHKNGLDDHCPMNVRFDFISTYEQPGFFIYKNQRASFTFGLSINTMRSTTTFQVAKRSIKNIKQVPIFDGRKGLQYCLFHPAKTESIENNNFFENESEGISIFEDDVAIFLEYFLGKYFKYDGINNKLDPNNYKSFDLYSGGLYLKTTFEILLKEIEEKILLLMDDFENKNLSKVREFFDYESLTDEFEDNSLTEEKIYVAIDFYRRFISRLNYMINNFPDCDLIVLDGV